MDTRRIAQEVRLGQWAEVMRARAESGMTVKDYCQVHGVNLKSYYYWQRLLRQRACEEIAERREQSLMPPEEQQEQSLSAVPPPHFAEIAPPAMTPSYVGPAIVVSMGKVRVEINSAAEGETVERVLRVLSEK